MNPLHKLIEDHYRENYRKLVKRTTWRVPYRAEHLAEECVQEAYTRAVKYEKVFNKDRENFNTWFDAILRNTINDCRTVEKDKGATVEITDDCTPITPDRKERMMAIHYLKNMESNSKQRVLSLFLLYGFKTREISELLGIKHNTVRQTISRWRASDF